QQGQIDLAWIFYGWQGLQAQQLGVDLDLVMMSDHFDCIPDYYTPILIASETTLKDRPEVVRAFLAAASRGYTFAAQHPDQAADILLASAPELDPALVRASQTWISPRYQAEAPRWGEQSSKRWQAYADWMTSEGILPSHLDMTSAFTNDYLP
ncbi:MAG TPA: ABC transporter substrate-binding protein, partial [Anaerolineales bacterium]|nr:ABC transporter substrate-binding protein [Anaerolineales bacterium]